MQQAGILFLYLLRRVISLFSTKKLVIALFWLNIHILRSHFNQILVNTVNGDLVKGVHKTNLNPRVEPCNCQYILSREGRGSHTLPIVDQVFLYII